MGRLNNFWGQYLCSNVLTYLGEHGQKKIVSYEGLLPSLLSSACGMPSLIVGKRLVEQCVKLFG